MFGFRKTGFVRALALFVLSSSDGWPNILLSGDGATGFFFVPLVICALLR
jgi:hypothetical protein